MRPRGKGLAADHQEAETAGEPLEDVAVTLVHGYGEGAVPWDPPELNPPGRCNK